MRCACVLAAASLMNTRHGTLIPTDLTISAQRAVSLSIRARNCAGEAWDTVTPSGARRVANSCDARMALRSAVRRAAISAGRPAGASTPHQCSTTRSLPLSLKVGIFAGVAVPSRVVLEFGDAISGISRVSGQAARSIG